MYPRHCSLFDCGGTSVICIGRLRWLRFACALVVTLGARQHRLLPLASITTGKVTCDSLWVSTLRVHFMSSHRWCVMSVVCGLGKLYLHPVTHSAGDHSMLSVSIMVVVVAYTRSQNRVYGSYNCEWYDTKAVSIS